MDTIKRDRLFKQQPSVLAAAVRNVSSVELTRLCATLASRLGTSTSVGSTLVSELNSRRQPVNAANAESDSFNLLDCFRAARVMPHSRVYVNWNSFEEVDSIDVNVLATYFSYFWYPKADYIDIFDEDADWVLSIDNDGYPWLVRLP